MRTIAASLFLSLAACGGIAEGPPARDVLPLKTLRLYESGVGYFERSGELTSASSMSLPVPAGHLDDALKTLVVLSKNGNSSVQAVEFPSSVGRAMARALAGLPEDADAPLAYKDLLVSLRGANVAVKARHFEIRGRVIDVVSDLPQKQANSDSTTDDKAAAKIGASSDAKPGDDFTLLLLTETGAVERVRAPEIESVRALDPAFATRLDAALDALAPHGAQDRALEVLAHSSGPITLGYIAETPIYRTTYRLVFDSDGHAGALQGWALIHNDTDENWHSVHVDLVNGRPDSFLFPLAAPRYERRALVTPERQLSTVPQLLDKTPDGIWGDNIDTVGLDSFGTLGHGEGGGGYGYGSGHGSLGGMHSAKEVVTESSALTVGNLAGIADATGVEAGALFTYSLGAPIDLRAHNSALLPFLSRTVTVDEITWISDFDASPRAAAHLVNNTTQTLPPGPIAFFAQGGFSGESKIDRLKPGERRFIEYGADLDLNVERKDITVAEAPKKASFDNDTFKEDFLRTTDWKYEFENRSGRAKNVQASLPTISNATITGADKLDYDSENSRPVAVFTIAPAKKIEKPMRTVEGLSRQIGINQLSSVELEKLATALGAGGAGVLDVAHKQKDVEDTKKKIEKANEQIAESEKDLARWRENLKAAGGGEKGGAPATLVTRVVQLEDKRDKLKASLEPLQAELTARTTALRASLVKLGK
jgi:hypothetical protein